MNEPTRDDLRVRCSDICCVHGDNQTHLTDAEFDVIAREEGYVRLDGGSLVTRKDWEGFLRMASNGETYDLEAVFEARLAALNPKEPT